MNLKIQNYNILNFNNQNIIISEKGVARVNSPTLLEVITKLNNRPNITDDKLYDLFHEHNLDKGDAYLSLETMLGLRKENEDAYFKRTLIIHDWENHNQLESLIKSELPDTVVTYPIPNLDLSIEKGEKTFVVLLCKNYDYQKIKKYYFSFTSNHPDSAISVAYINGDHFIISQPYVPTLGSPCHFCTIDRLIENEAHQPSKNTWSGLLNFCRSKKTSVPAPRLSMYQQTLIIGALIQKIKLIAGNGDSYRYQDNVLQETRISLSNGELSEFSIAHWCMCDCLRIKA